MFEAYSKDVEAKMIAYYRLLPENLRRKYAAAEAAKLKYGGKGYICKLLGVSYLTLQKGFKELSDPEGHPEPPNGKQRRNSGWGKKKRLALMTAVPSCEP